MIMYPTTMNKRLCPHCSKMDYETKYDDGYCGYCKGDLRDVPWENVDLSTPKDAFANSTKPD